MNRRAGALPALGLAAGIVLAIANAGAAEKSVKASSFGWNASDATVALQAALDSGVKKVIVDRQAGDWIVRPLFVRSNTEIVFEDGVVVRAKQDEFHHPNDCLFLVRDVENVTLRGEGHAVLRMERDTYADRARYSFSEWRHALAIIGCRNVKASDLELRYSGGDGVYVCRSEDVDLRRLDVRDHYRQGVSVISAHRLYVGRCRFNDTRGTPPACGIDFEPNNARDYLVDCIVDGCEFAGNGHGGVLFHLLQLSDRTEPVSVTVKNCRLTGNASGLIVTAASNCQPPVKGNVLIENCEIVGNSGRSATFNGLSASSVQVELKGCRMTSKVTGCPDIEFNNNNFVEDFAGLRFTDTVLRTVNATPVSFVAAMGTGVRSVDGTLTVERNGKSAAFDFATFAAANKPDPEVVKLFGVSKIDYSRLRPVSDHPVTKALPQVRGRFTFVQALPTAGEYAVEFRTLRLGGSPINYEVRMRDQLGTDLGVVVITSAVQKVVFRGGPGNIRRFEVNTKGHALSIFSPHPGQGLRIDDKVNVFGGSHRLYFAVPSAAEKVVVKVEPEEPAAFAIQDGEGRTLAEKPSDSMVKTFDAAHQPGRDEVWSLRIDAVEDMIFRAGSSIVPLVAPEKDAILVEGE